MSIFGGFVFSLFPSPLELFAGRLDLLVREQTLLFLKIWGHHCSTRCLFGLWDAHFRPWLKLFMGLAFWQFFSFLSLLCIIVDTFRRRLYHWIGLESPRIWNLASILSTQQISIVSKTTKLLLVSKNKPGKECLDLQAQFVSSWSSRGSLSSSSKNMSWCWRTKATIL